MMLKILMLGTYPIKNQLHGGQIRVSEILKKYKHHGIDARFIAIYNNNSDDYNHSNKEDIGIYIPPGLIKNHYISDFIIGQQVANDKSLFSKLTATIVEMRPDFIQLEQPWLFPYYQKLCNLYPEIKLIYSSQNIEYKLKKNILKLAGYSSAIYSSVCSEIKKLEKDVCKNASLVIAVTDKEADELKKFGASNVIIASNASSIKETPNKKIIHYWENKLNQERFGLYVGSAHPPNTHGFMKLLGPALGFLAPNQQIILAGGVGSSICNYDHGIFKLLNWSRLNNLGVISNKDLATVIQMSSVLLLPIIEKGGSNIKTAEAILSGKLVIATSTAFRGYEEYKNDRYVTIADNPDDFKEAIKKCLRKNFNISSDRSDDKYKKLLWNNALEIIPKTLLQITGAQKK